MSSGFADRISFNSIQSRLYREQMKYRYKIPKSMLELAEFLPNFDKTNSIFKGFVVDDEGHVAILFSTDELLKLLNETDEISCDGTFAINTI